MKDNLIIKARQALESLWKEACLKGSLCWGPKIKGNPYSGTNIIIGIGDELISVSRADNGKLRIHQFLKVKNTTLGKKVKEIFQEKGLVFEE